MRHSLAILTGILGLLSYSAESRADLTLNVSGSDGSVGYDGDDAGHITLNLSYADTAKTMVQIEGQTVYRNRTTPVSQIISLQELGHINLYAVGGDGGDGQDGASGRDGNSGSDGSDGWDGRDGCPPSDGHDGSDGYNGTDGTDGQDGTNAGSGGNGGQIQVTAPADQSELLLLVNAKRYGGDGGEGGSGGRGGQGGRGGRGGDGGDGGDNTCKDDQGQPTNGPDGRDGRDGDDGRSGSDGRDGRNGNNGYNGAQGTLVFTTTAAGSSRNYSSVFRLDLNAVQVLDDNEDSVLQPGEDLHVTQITLKNLGEMPTPAGQIIHLIFENSSTLSLRNAPPIMVQNPIPPQGTVVLNFLKGQIVFQTIDDASAVGRPTQIDAQFAINAIASGTGVGTEIAIGWPLSLAHGADQLSGYFGSPSTLNYTLQNVSTKDIGPDGVQPMELEFSWTSDTMPGADVTMTLADGRAFTLGSPVSVADLSVPARSTVALPIIVLVRNSRALLEAQGTLQIRVKLKDFTGPGTDAVAQFSSPLRLVIDLRGQAFERTLDLDHLDIECRFPNHFVAKYMDIDWLRISKVANSDRVTYQFHRSAFLAGGDSPALSSGAFEFSPHSGLLTQDPLRPADVVKLLNANVAPATGTIADDDGWLIEPDSCRFSER